MSSHIALNNIPSYVDSAINTTNTTTTFPEAYVLLSIDNDRSPFETYTFDLVLNVIPALSDGSFDNSNTYQQTLTVEFKPQANTGNAIDQIYHKIENRYGAKLEVVSYTKTTESGQQANVPDNIELIIGFKAIRVTHLNLSTPSTPSLSSTAND